MPRPYTICVVKKWRFPAVFGVLVIIFAAIASAYVRGYALSLGTAAAIYTCFLLFLVLVIAPGMPASRAFVERQLKIRGRSLMLVALWCAPYLIYSAGTSDLRGTALLRLLAVALLPVAIYRFWPVRDVSRFCWQDLVVAILLIAAVLGHVLSGVWNIPVNLDFMGRLYLVVVGAWCWVFLRPLPRLGYEFFISRKVCKAAALNFIYFAAIAIPAGLALHFIRWNPHWPGITAFALDYLEIFLFIALLEELFFRGFLQTLISGSLRSEWRGQAIVACLFGLFHILHAPFPNWRYVALATVAGWFYGSAFRQGGNLIAPALTHAMVDTAWRTWFAKS